VQVLGLNTQRYKLLAFVISAALAALLGVVMLIAAGSAAPRFADAGVTISLLLMVVLGGAVTRWGAVIGGIFYSVATTRINLIRDNPSVGAIREEAVRTGMKYLQEDGLRQVVAGNTSIQEILRVCK
jgi:branched-chain amino acid transport system permease protein